MRLVRVPIGSRHRNLEVTGPCQPGDKGKRLLPCRCVLCGTEALFQKGNVLNGAANCNCHREVLGGKSNTHEGIMFMAARRRARKAGLPFTITLENIQIPDRCPVLGISMRRGKGNGNHQPCSPTLDRIDPEKGYVPGNVWVICYKANRMKSDATIEELELLVQALKRARQ